MKQLNCPHHISISGLVRGCMLGYKPDTCEECTHPDKKYIEVIMSSSTTYTG